MEPPNESGLFDLEEFKALRQEILQKVDAISKLEVLTVSAAAAVYAWLGTREVETSRALWFIPVFFPLLGSFRAVILGHQAYLAGEYLSALEKRLRPVPIAPHGVHGWEGFIRLHSVRKQFLDRVTYVFWAVFLLLTILVPFFFAAPRK